MTKLLLRNGQVVDPSQGLNGPMDVLVEDGHIAEVAPAIGLERGDNVVDLAGLVVVPGFIDVHVHLREPGGEGAETIASGTRAAAAGGFTTIYAMPNTSPVCDTQTGVDYVLSRAATEGCVRVVPVAAVTVGQEGGGLTNMGVLLKAGAGAFSDDGHPIMNAEVMRRALEYTRMFDVPILDHCEDMDLTGNGVMHEGATSLRLGLKGIPRVSESTIVARDVALAAATGGRLHVCHVSTRESVEAIREGKRSGVRVTAEASPHHLTMVDEDVGDYDTNRKMKPPLCAREDRDALVAALEDGTIDCIATDHAPHSATAKNSTFDAAPFGIIGMETAFPVLYTAFVATGRWTLEFLVDRLTIAPARVMGRNWGTLRPGAQADIAVLELGTEYTFTEDRLRSRSRNCPWLGSVFTGRAAATLVAGRPVHEDIDIFPSGIFGGRPQRTTSAQPAPKAKKPAGKAKKPATKTKKRRG